MEQFITQCPNCGTSFRVSQQQLQVANGSVRCGSCMHIFQARAHQPGHKKANTDPALEFSYDKADDKDFDKATKHSHTDDTSEFSESFLELSRWRNDKTTYTDIDNSDTQTSEADEQWARDLLENDEKGTEREKGIEQRETAILRQSRKANFQAQLEEASSKLQTPDRDINSFSAIDGDDKLIGELDFDNSGNKQGWGNDSTSLKNLQRERILTHIQPGPVEIHMDTRSKWLKNTLWSLAFLLSLTALAAQSLYFNFEKLALTHQYRPIYAYLCQQLNCKLPPLENINAIKTSNLMVRTHPDRENALIVDAIITNRAQYPQPFPDLELVFTNLQGQVVAGRIFLPKEYLSGELKSTTAIPAQRPVHLSLEIIDPGPNATNYAVQLHKSQSS